MLCTDWGAGCRGADACHNWNRSPRSVHLTGRYTSVSESNSQQPPVLPQPTACSGWPRVRAAPGGRQPPPPAAWRVPLSGLGAGVGGGSGGEEGMRMTGPPQSVGLGSDLRPGVSKEETRAGHTATHIRASRPGSLTRVFRSVFPEARSFCAFYRSPAATAGLLAGARSTRTIRNAEMLSKTNTSPQQS